MIPLGSLNLALARAFEAAGQRTPAAGYEWKNGKLEPIKKRQSVSAKIRQRKSKKVTPTRRVKGSQAP